MDKYEARGKQSLLAFFYSTHPLNLLLNALLDLDLIEDDTHKSSRQS